jgi:hypothetical protein
MDKLLEALKKLLPEDQYQEVAVAAEGIINDAREELKREFEAKLEEAYKELSGELKEAEKVAEHGYMEAFGMINDLRGRLVTQQKEFEATLDEGYEEAYQMLKNEQGKNNSITIDVYEEYDKKLNEMKDYIVEKVDQFLQFKGAEIYEQAKRDVLNDPRMAEHKVTLDKIIDITANYLSDEDKAIATSSKLAEAYKRLEELQGHAKLMEARNIKLDQDNRKLNEAVKHAQNVITEGRTVEKKERTRKATQVSGRGRVVEDEDTRVIAEYANPNAKKNRRADTDDDSDEDTSLLEGVDFATLNVLAGTKKSN